MREDLTSDYLKSQTELFINRKEENETKGRKGRLGVVSFVQGFLTGGQNLQTSRHQSEYFVFQSFYIFSGFSQRSKTISVSAAAMHYKNPGAAGECHWEICKLKYGKGKASR